MTGCKDCKYLKSKYSPRSPREVKIIWERNKVLCFCSLLNITLGLADRRKDLTKVHADCPFQ